MTDDADIRAQRLSGRLNSVRGVCGLSAYPPFDAVFLMAKEPASVAWEQSNVSCYNVTCSN